ncbi:MAG: hypothetical protein ACO36A_02610 [Ilumatobacteraceae bacterium]
MVTRNEGYGRGAGKEELALTALRGFLTEKIGNAGDEITGYDDNYRMGDLRFPSGTTVECKGQPIDPARYTQNFVEVFEVTRNDLHMGGLDRAAELLGMSVADLTRTSVRVRGTTGTVGDQPRVSVSISSIATAGFTAYVNYVDGGRHIYVYERDELMGHIRTAARRGFVRGAGNSNEDTFAVFVPLSRMRWSRSGASWRAAGDEPEQESLARLSRSLL